MDTTQAERHVREVFSDLFERAAGDEQKVLLALLERLAAEQYRVWARESRDFEVKRLLNDAAMREDRNADTIERCVPRASWTELVLASRVPTPAEIYRGLLAGRPLEARFALQAAAERLAAAMYEQFAENADSAMQREVFRACAQRESTNAETLDAILTRALAA